MQKVHNVARMLAGARVAEPALYYDGSVHLCAERELAMAIRGDCAHHHFWPNMTILVGKPCETMGNHGKPWKTDRNRPFGSIWGNLNLQLKTARGFDQTHSFHFLLIVMLKLCQKLLVYRRNTPGVCVNLLR